MPKFTRHKTKYPGVYYIEGTPSGCSKPEPIYYIRYRKGDRSIEEKVGSKSRDDMTPARANAVRSARLSGAQPSNKEKREIAAERKRLDANRWTMDRLWQEYKDNKSDVKGIKFDNNRYDNHIGPTLGHKEPKDIAPLDVDRIRINLLKTKSPATVRNVLELIRRIANFGLKKQLCPGLGFIIEMPTVNNLKTEFLTDEELKKFWQAVNDDPNIQVANFMKMAILTGLRRGELFNLEWKSIEFQRGFIRIIDPKGGEDKEVPMNSAVRELLESHPKTSSPYVFPGRNGKKRTDINHQANRIKSNAGLPKDFRPLHGLRHTYASMLASCGEVDMYTLQKLMTHKSPQMTQRYAHLHDDALKRASAVVEKLVRGSVESFEDEKGDEIAGSSD